MRELGCAASWLLLFFFFATSVPAATPDSFKTPEYFKSGALDVINAAEAYARGYTGAGVTVGVIDEMVRVDHPELAGKAATATAVVNETGQPFVPDWTQDQHGSHVAGIVAAKRDGLGMHGVAFDAAVWGGPFLTHEDGISLSLDWDAYFAARPQTRIFNNSWGSEWIRYYDPGSGDIFSLDEVGQTIENDPNLSAVMEYAIEHPESVMVFAAGNDGMNSPALDALLPRYSGSDLRNWLSVGALDSACITRTSDGTTFTLSPGAVSWFSDLAAGAELWTVMAPGSQIISLNASTNGYMPDSGTSMAAPVVSGALALVQQAYPWMTGKQLADAVLTTADNTFTAPTYIVSFNPDQKQLFIRIIDNGISAPGDTAAAKVLVAQAYNEHPEAWLGYTLQALYDVMDAGYTVENLSKEQVFGQGILNAGKAVRGVARLDANRMSAADVKDLPELGPLRKDALETFDTRGHLAEFSNDISQRQWDDTYHYPEFQTTGIDPEYNGDALALEGKDVGLRKTGAGLLILSGDNSYEGATVIEGGGLSISQRADGTGGVLHSSDVLVRARGLLLGNGEIVKSVRNSGVVAPGNSIGVLTVGDYTQDAGGVLRIEYDAAGNHDVLKVTNSAKLDGTLALAPQAGFYRAPLSVAPLEATNAPTGNFSAVLPVPASPTLTMYVSGGLSGNYLLQTSRAADAYSRYADSTGAGSVGRAMPGVAATAHGDMQTLLAALDFSAPDGNGVRRGLTQLGPEAYDAASRAALAQQREFNILLLRRMLANESMRRMDSRPTQEADGAAPPAQGLAAGDEPLSGWTAWISPFGSSGMQNDHSGTAGWASSGVGILGGMERRWDAGLTLGLHLALAGRRTDVNGHHEARAETRGAYIGAQALYAPDVWDGFYLTGQVRLGLEDSEMRRDVAFNGYARHNESRWTGLTGGALLGAGKDWTWGEYSAGPLGWLEYGFVQRPDISETGGRASRLNVDGGVYDSLLLSLGGHLGRAWELPNHAGLAVDLLAAWRHELLDGAFRSGASFRGYGNAGFESATDLVGRDALLAQGSLRLTRGNDFFAQVDLGGEFRTAASSVNAGLSFGWEF